MTTRSNGVFVKFLDKRFRALGFHTKRQKFIRRGIPFYNFLAVKGPSSRRPLLLNTHLDTVPPGPLNRWTSTGQNPWRATLRNGRLYGLGVADVKLNLLCQWEALRQLGNTPFQKSLLVAGTFGEESGLLGAQHLLSQWRGPRPEFVSVGEPSQMRVMNRHRGYLVFEWEVQCPFTQMPHGPWTTATIDVRGRSAHSSTPHLGVNAIEKGLRLFRQWQSAQRNFRVMSLEGGTAANQIPADLTGHLLLSPPFPLIPAKGVKVSRPKRWSGPRRRVSVPWPLLEKLVVRLHGLFPPTFTTNVGRLRMEGSRLCVVFDVRFPPGHSAVTLIRRVRGMARTLGQDHCLKERLVVERNNPALFNPRQGPWFRRIEQALKREGLAPRYGMKPTCTEAGLFRQWGVPSVVLGPGVSAGNVHRPNESIALRDLEKAIGFYRELIRRWCLP